MPTISSTIYGAIQTLQLLWGENFCSYLRNCSAFPFCNSAGWKSLGEDSFIKGWRAAWSLWFPSAGREAGPHICRVFWCFYKALPIGQGRGGPSVKIFRNIATKCISGVCNEEIPLLWLRGYSSEWELWGLASLLFSGNVIVRVFWQEIHGVTIQTGTIFLDWKYLGNNNEEKKKPPNRKVITDALKLKKKPDIFWQISSPKPCKVERPSARMFVRKLFFLGNVGCLLKTIFSKCLRWGHPLKLPSWQRNFNALHAHLASQNASLTLPQYFIFLGAEVIPR